jgi:hypothetical protein
MRYGVFGMVLLACGQLSGCAAVSVASAAVSVASTAVSVGATVVGAAVDVTAAGVKAAANAASSSPTPPACPAGMVCTPAP